MLEMRAGIGKDLRNDTLVMMQLLIPIMMLMRMMLSFSENCRVDAGPR